MSVPELLHLHAAMTASLYIRWVCSLADLKGELRAGKSRVEPSARQALVLSRGIFQIVVLVVVHPAQIG